MSQDYGEDLLKYMYSEGSCDTNVCIDEFELPRDYNIRYGGIIANNNKLFYCMSHIIIHIKVVISGSTQVISGAYITKDLTMR